jgi:hypothetical protein
MVHGQEIDLKQLAVPVNDARAHLANLSDEIHVALRYQNVAGWEPDINHYEIHLMSAKANIGRAINILRGVHGNEQEEDHD